MNKNLFFPLLFTALVSQAQTKKSLIFRSDFSVPLDCKTWITEIAPQPGYTSTVYTHKKALVMDTRGGVTVWLNKVLSGNIQIEYDRVIRMDGKCNDRLSDMNQFWMASDPEKNNLFTRTGRFEEYDNLCLYYAGIGGHNNTKSRFRKYKPGDKPVIKEYEDRAHLLQEEKRYHIKIIVYKGNTSFWVNNVCYFNYTDPALLTSGYFGFRSLQSRQEIKHLKIYRLE